MSPEISAALGALAALGGLLLIALVVDQFFGPLPTFRKHRDKVLAGLGGLVGVVLFVLTFGKRKPKPKPEPVKPKEYDDAKIIEIEKDAADLDVDAAGDAAGEPSLDDLQSELDNL